MIFLIGTDAITYMQRITTNIFNNHMQLLWWHLHGFINPCPPLRFATFLCLKLQIDIVLFNNQELQVLYYV